jgi:methylenetetrahydrofolate--tRNA-(uracil-5-)-methyltransferase
MMNQHDLIVIGGGLAGSEAAWQAAQQGLKVTLYEMRPKLQTGAHTGYFLAELVCSNSLGSNLPDRAPGLLKEELRRLGSLIVACAEESAVPAGSALAVDREVFAQTVTERIENHGNIRLIREELGEIPSTPAIIATGPLTSSRMSRALKELSGLGHLYFYDAISPIVNVESIDLEMAFRGSRYQKGELVGGDYINCPMTREEYDRFVDALLGAERIVLKDFERDLESGVRAGAHEFFEGCLPVEILAQRGREALAYGPMRPVGLADPRTGRRPYAVVQLRQDNLAGTLYNLVGFQTNLKFGEQKRVFRLIPGLEAAEFVRFGQMHRNTFIHSPTLLLPTLQFHSREDLFFAGQITGVEGYMGNAATGLLAGLNASRVLRGLQPLIIPETTMLGALCYYVTHASPADFQPMKANFGILPQLDTSQRPRNKRKRAAAYVHRALADLEIYMQEVIYGGNERNMAFSGISNPHEQSR